MIPHHELGKWQHLSKCDFKLVNFIFEYLIVPIFSGVDTCPQELNLKEHVHLTVLHCWNVRIFIFFCCRIVFEKLYVVFCNGIGMLECWTFNLLLL